MINKFKKSSGKKKKVQIRNSPFLLGGGSFKDTLLITSAIFSKARGFFSQARTQHLGKNFLLKTIYYFSCVNQDRCCLKLTNSLALSINSVPLKMGIFKSVKIIWTSSMSLRTSRAFRPSTTSKQYGPSPLNISSP